MNTKIWLKDKFTLKTDLSWICPNCNLGMLNIEKDNFNFQETKESKNEHTQDYWDPEFIKYRFTGSLKCNACEDITFFTGNGGVVHGGYYDAIEDQYHDDFYDEFTPLFFNPPLEIFKLKDIYPKDIKEEIQNSFIHLWNDLSSCANSIRSSLEILLNENKIKKYNIKSGKRNRLNLHQRIEEFKKKNPEVGEYLLAIKWIGNVGSHPGNLSKLDILETYELLEHSLDKLYENKEEKLKKMSKEIIKRRGLRKRK